jgi:hypothetical protein
MSDFHNDYEMRLGHFLFGPDGEGYGIFEHPSEAFAEAERLGFPNFTISNRFMRSDERYLSEVEANV